MTINWIIRAFAAALVDGLTAWLIVFARGVRGAGARVAWLLLRMFWMMVYAVVTAAAMAAAVGAVYGLVLITPPVIEAVARHWSPVGKQETKPEEKTRKGPWNVATDAKGETEFLVLADECHWVRGSASKIECRGKEYTGREFVRSQLMPFLSVRIEGGADLISIGAASGEGLAEREKVRANERARNIARWIHEQVPVKGRVWVGNMGQFKSSCAGCSTDTGWQRPVIIATLVRRDDVDVSVEFMKRKMKENPIIPDPDEYEQFELERLYGLAW